MDHCATRLAAREDPALETLKMQLAIEDTAATQTKTAAKEARDRDDRVGALERDVADAVVDSATVSGREERLLLDRLHDAAFRYVCVACRMEIALEDDDVAEETRAAFESVFPRHDLRRFFTLPPDERSSASASSQAVVLGVRVYNRSVGDGGLRLDDPTPRYLALADATKADLDAKLASTERLVDNTQSLLRISELKTIRARATSFADSQTSTTTGGVTATPCDDARRSARGGRRPCARSRSR